MPWQMKSIPLQHVKVCRLSTIFQHSFELQNVILTILKIVLFILIALWKEQIILSPMLSISREQTVLEQSLHSVVLMAYLTQTLWRRKHVLHAHAEDGWAAFFTRLIA